MQGHPTYPISAAQADYNVQAEDAFQRLIAARNKGADYHGSLDAYKADIAAARQATGIDHFKLV